jgi:hypothetical protein
MSQIISFGSGGGGSSVLTLTGNSGGPISPTAGNINTIGGNNITAAGNPGTSTLTFSVTGTTNHAVQIGNASGSLTSVAVGTTGQVLTGVTGGDPVFAAPAASSISITGDSGGALTGNAFTFTGGSTGLTFAGVGTTETLGGTLAIANGGTNATSMTNTFGVNYFDGTRLVTTTVGTAGQILTSNGAGVAPTFQTSGGGGITTIAGDTGTATGSTVTFNGLSQAGSTVSFKASGSTVSFNTSDSRGNTIIGTGAGNSSLTTSFIVGLGANVFSALTFGDFSVAVGANALNVVTSGNENVAIGAFALSATVTDRQNTAVGFAAMGALNGSGNAIENTSLGYQSLTNLATGANNIAIGFNAGVSYNGAESENILIGPIGVASETNVTRIGYLNSGSSTQQFCYIDGIISATPGVGFSVVGINPSTGQLTNGVTDANGNTIIGLSAGNASITGTGNTGLGKSVLTGLTNGTLNVAIGESALTASTGDTENTAIGWEAMAVLNGGSNNTSLGTSSLGQLGTGNFNIALGYSAGFNYTGAESGNIIIGSGDIAAESNQTKIGFIGGSTSQTGCFIDGITGVSVVGAAVIVSASGQLGVTVSSVKFKDNIQPLGATKVLQLDPKSFTMKNDDSKSKCVGLIAEEVVMVIPELVVNDIQGNPLTVKYQDLAIYLLQELKTLRAEFDAFKEKQCH